MNQTSTTELMTKKEVANFFSVTLTTIDRWTKKGRLKAFGLEGRVYFKREQVESSLTPLNPTK